MITNRRPIITGVSWSGAIAGALIGLILFTALSALGMAVAGATLSYDSLSAVGWGSLIWMVLCLAASGYVTGIVAGIGAPGLTTKTAATLSGITAGCVLVLVLSMVSYNLISSAVQTTASIASGTASVVGSAASAAGSAAQAGASRLDQINFENLEVEGALREVGLAEEYNSITAGEFDRADLEQAIAEASPELNQTQVSATVDEVLNVLDGAQQNIAQNIGSVQDVRQLPENIRSEWQRVTNQLTGEQFVTRLENQGLTTSQAQEVTTVIAQRINQMQREAGQALDSLQQGLIDLENRVGEFANEAVETTGEVASTSAMSWLVVAMILVGLAGLGGFQQNRERQIEQEARERTAAGTRGQAEPIWSDEGPRRVENI